MEIERQFLVDNLPQLPEKYELLRQGYVALWPEIRIRQIGDSRFWLTVKRGAGLVREEWETEISSQEFDSLAKRLCPGTCMIEKRRYKSLLRMVLWQSCMCMQVILQGSIMWKWNFRM